MNTKTYIVKNNSGAEQGILEWVRKLSIPKGKANRVF
jgi:hypothetical protein